jgi:dCMP deaminase
LTNGIHAERKMSLHTPARKPDPYLATGRSTYLPWDDYFMSVAFLSAQRSKDPNKQVGAVIVGPGKIICGVGYNGFPRGCGDNELPWAKKSRDNDPMDTKYAYVCHAEMNAIMNKNAQNLDGASLYVTMYPCNECAKLVIQSGIKEVVYFEGKDVPGDVVVPGDDPKTKKQNPVNATPTRGGTRPDPTYAAAGKLLALADVRIRQHTPSATVDVTYE